jgi:hypothetical protein
MKHFEPRFFIFVAFFLNYITCQQATVNVVTTGSASSSVVVSWTHRGTFTNFFVTSRLTGATVSNAWLGIGLNSLGRMVIKYVYKVFLAVFRHLVKSLCSGTKLKLTDTKNIPEYQLKL